MPSLKREAERRGKAAANTRPSTNSEGRANSMAEETDEPARGSGSLHMELFQGLCFACLRRGNRREGLNANRKADEKGSTQNQHSPTATTDAKIQVGCVPATGRRSTLLQTAQARLQNSNGSSMVVSCLFESGAQRSFVKKSVADALSLEFWISPLNGKHDEKQLVEALCLPKICQKLKLVPNIYRLRHLTALQLADDFTGNSDVFDVVIGWIICGAMTNEKRQPTSSSHSVKIL
ncbi:hypothetical protein T4B_1261 [Trichinella pseudospiralis]|uniref:Peptidase aspartic putative domain-containing protein n=1 Tax=Trichinella pseudospiralis TaxID=6337 RepID=A0A0V1H3R8_TRIPS|nr:hypothetical protein T4B_1261 [Trichinella pseudospiralis]